MEVKLNLDVINQVLGYLGTKPYGEVYQLINVINQQALLQVQAQQEAQKALETAPQ
jgi:hypothetical protein